MKIKSANIKSINIDGNKGIITFQLFQPLKPKKISSTWIPQLLGLSEFSKRGDKLLEFWGFAEKEPFDDVYTLRGEVAELLIVKALEAKGFKPKRYDKNEYDYDLFKYDGTKGDDNKLNKLYKFFSGLPDVVYRDENKVIRLLEVKAKDFGKLGSNPYGYEIMQGRILAMLYGVDEVVMTAIYFSDSVMRNFYMCSTTDGERFDLEKSLKLFWNKYPNGLQYGKDKDYFIEKKVVEVKKYELIEDMKEAYKYAETFRQTLTIKISDLSQPTYSEIFKLESEIG